MKKSFLNLNCSIDEVYLLVYGICHWYVYDLIMSAQQLGFAEISAIKYSLLPRGNNEPTELLVWESFSVSADINTHFQHDFGVGSSSLWKDNVVSRSAIICKSMRYEMLIYFLNCCVVFAGFWFYCVFDHLCCCHL